MTLTHVLWLASAVVVALARALGPSVFKYLTCRRALHGVPVGKRAEILRAVGECWQAPNILWRRHGS